MRNIKTGTIAKYEGQKCKGKELHMRLWIQIDFKENIVSIWLP